MLRRLRFVAEDIKLAIANYYATEKTLEIKRNPTSDEGKDAERSMETRHSHALKTRDELILELLDETSVYLAGGELIAGALLTEKVESAAKSCLARLYPQFHHADFADWHKVFERAKKAMATRCKQSAIRATRTRTPFAKRFGITSAPVRRAPAFARTSGLRRMAGRKTRSTPRWSSYTHQWSASGSQWQ